jgi:hypothetical protein
MTELEDRKELGIKIRKTVTKSNENVAVIHEENVRNRNPMPLSKNHRFGDDSRSITTCHKYLNGKYL